MHWVPNCHQWGQENVTGFESCGCARFRVVLLVVKLRLVEECEKEDISSTLNNVILILVAISRVRRVFRKWGHMAYVV